MELMTFEIRSDGDSSAGLLPFSNLIVLSVHEDPGGEPGDFKDFLTETLREWFDGAEVQCRWIADGDRSITAIDTLRVITGVGGGDHEA